MEIPSLFMDTYKLLMECINTGKIWAEFVAELM